MCTSIHKNEHSSYFKAIETGAMDYDMSGSPSMSTMNSLYPNAQVNDIYHLMTIPFNVQNSYSAQITSR